MVRIAFLQTVKEHIQRTLIVLVVLTGGSVLNHIHHRFKVLFFLRRFVEQIEDQRTVQCDFRLLPKGIVGHRGLRRGVADDVGNELQHIGIASQIGKGVIAVGLCRVYQIKYFHLISFFDEQGRGGAEQFAFRIGDDVGRMCLHQIRAGEAAAFTRAAAADAEDIDILLVLIPVQTEAEFVCQDDVIALFFIAVFGVELPDAAPYGATVFFSWASLFSARVVAGNAKGIGDQRAEDKARRVMIEADGKRRLCRCHKGAYLHQQIFSLHIAACENHRTPHYGDRQCRPHRGGIALISWLHLVSASLNIRFSGA